MSRTSHNLPVRKLRRDLTIAFNGRLYSLAHLGHTLVGAQVRVEPISGSESVSVEIHVDGIRARHAVHPLVIDEFGFRSDAILLGA